LIVVSDRSPILNLALIGRLNILPAMYEEVLVPPSVYRELTVDEADQPSLIIDSSSWLRTKIPKDQQRIRILRERLDEGEAEEIILALETHAELLLIDERQGRRIAASAGLRITGLIGVLVEAKTRALIDQVRPIHDDLIMTANFWVERELYNDVLRNLGEL